ncbi:TPA: hypothetical protein CPT96_05865 [Candidatus Gastranaerophilales bacterium HUM_10]|nr:MAG TPA: hypothetical protein CPT96_05865 [Candidatus Gastranaerophilales bacterium HUM_10]
MEIKKKGRKIMTKTLDELKRKYEFILADFKKSGINKSTILDYVEKGYLSETDDYWQLNYPALYANYKTDYYNRRLKNPEYGKGKYIKPAGKPSQIFRPLDLSISMLKDPTMPIIITEGDKKAIKAVQEGFPCLSLGGVWGWKCKADTIDLEENPEWELTADIIPDLVHSDFKDKVVILCYDNDMYHNVKVKQALYSLAGYLISEKGAKVKLIFLPKGEAKGLDDFLVAYGADEFQKLLDKAEFITLEKIQNKLSGKKEIAEFPVEVFPEPVKDLILELHKRMDAPIEYIACTFLIVASILMDGHYAINVNPGTNWIEHPILWLALIGNPSQKKTPCLKIGKDILNEYDLILRINYETDINDYNHKKDSYKIQLEKYKKAIKNNENPGELPIEPEKPKRPRLMTQDITKESLAYLMDINSKMHLGLAIFVDELAFFLKSWNQYKHGGNDMEYFLASWARERQNIVRKSDKSDYTFDASHNIIGTIQPKVLYETLFGKGIDCYNGMIERWLYCCSDYKETGFLYNSDKDYDISVFTEICRKIFTNAVLHPETVNMYQFDSEAKKAFEDFRTKIVHLKKSGKCDDITQSYLEKQTRYVARLALILHGMHSLEEKSVTGLDVNNAIKLCHYFISCFVVITDNKLHYDKCEECALNFIKRKKLKTVSPTELFRNNKTKIKDTKIAQATLEGLARKGYGRMIKAKNGVSFIYYGS